LVEGVRLAPDRLEGVVVHRVSLEGLDEIPNRP
jgi:hypothetical protein